MFIFRLCFSIGAVFAFAFGANMARADTVFDWVISGTYTLSTCTTVGGCPPGSPVVTTGQTWSASLNIDTTLGLGDPPPSTLTFNNLLPPGQDFGSLQGTCNSTANCTPLTPSLGGWQDWTTVPVGTTFELEACLNGSGHPCNNWVILDVDATGGTTSLVGFTGGTVLAGTEYGGVCAEGGIPSSPSESCASAIVSGSATPLPATLPLLVTGFGGLWAILRKRKEPLGGSLDPIAA
jgi:hypothetical protein